MEISEHDLLLLLLLLLMPLLMLLLHIMWLSGVRRISGACFSAR